jgi:hypothetical protein
LRRRAKARIRSENPREQGQHLRPPCFLQLQWRELSWLWLYF